MNVHVTGKLPKHITKEEIRAVVSATVSVMQYHGYELRAGHRTIKVSVRDKINVKGHKLVPDDLDLWGLASPHLGTFLVNRHIPTKAKFTDVLIHESLHLTAEWESAEYTTSTLVGRLKPAVMKIAEELATGTYQRAAWLAHGKMSYIVTEDHYNLEAEHAEAIVTSGNKLPVALQ